jgi:hypothetical protein
MPTKPRINEKKMSNTETLANSGFEQKAQHISSTAYSSKYMYNWIPLVPPSF